MTQFGKLPPLPRVAIDVLDDQSSAIGSDEGFLRIKRLVLQNRYDDGTRSAEFRYDVLDRSALDAVAMVLWAQVDGEPWVCLRSSIRPPLLFRASAEIPVREPEPSVVIWELPAGLIEPDEKGTQGVLRCAARETMEEVGFDLSAERFRLLGPACTVSPGAVGERLYFALAEVDLAARGTPTEDGHPVEERALVAFVPLPEARAALEDGRVADLKTEVGLRRLFALLEGGALR